jgi:squalene cyclase
LILAVVLAARAPSQDLALFPPGVDAEVAAAIDRGLEFLARTQNRDGSWRTNGGGGGYPVAMTGLAGMAVLCSGSTPTRGKYWRQLRRATEFLLGTQQSNGLFNVPDEGQSMYGHGFATLFLSQVHGMEEDQRHQERLHAALSRAVRLIASAQSRAGGWNYTPNSGDEGSVTVTQMQALRACRNAGIAVPIDVVKRGVQYIAKSANPDGGISYRIGMSGSRPAITAAAVAVLYSAGRYDDPMAVKALAYAKRMLPVGDGGQGHAYYAHLYLAQALYYDGGKDWEVYYQRMTRWLLKHQQTDGSWMGDGVGTTYGTAIALIVMQLPYAMVPIYQR